VPEHDAHENGHAAVNQLGFSDFRTGGTLELRGIRPQARMNSKGTITHPARFVVGAIGERLGSDWGAIGERNGQVRKAGAPETARTAESRID
jgi:hypothetical protein